MTSETTTPSRKTSHSLMSSDPHDRLASEASASLSARALHFSRIAISAARSATGTECR